MQRKRPRKIVKTIKPEDNKIIDDNINNNITTEETKKEEISEESKEQALQLIRSKAEEMKNALELRTRVLLGYEDLNASQALQPYSRFQRVDFNDIKNIHKKV